MRPTVAGIDKDRPDYTVFSGEWEIGRIYQTRGGPDSLRWFWSMNANGPMTRSDRVATLEEAKAHRNLIRSSSYRFSVVVALPARSSAPIQRERMRPFHQLPRRPLRGQEEGSPDATLHTAYPVSMIFGGHLGRFSEFRGDACAVGRDFSCLMLSSFGGSGHSGCPSSEILRQEAS